MGFRPCIDLHAGKVKQIVGSSLTDDSKSLVTNFEATLTAQDYARCVDVCPRMTGVCTLS